MNVDELKKNLHDVIERYRNKAEFTGEVCRDVMARDCLQVVEELEAENKQLEDYIDAYQKSEAINIAKLDEKDERIKELRESLIANDNHWLNVYKENIELKSKIRKLEGK